MLQQLPLALLLFTLGGLSWVIWVIWGICMRVSMSVLGHWLVGYFAHNETKKHRHKHWHVKNASIQGYNLPLTALVTFSESWHNNHHAHPDSANIGINKGEVDLGWQVLLFLQRLNLVWDLKQPKDLPFREELVLNSMVNNKARDNANNTLPY